MIEILLPLALVALLIILSIRGDGLSTRGDGKARFKRVADGRLSGKVSSD